MKYKIKPFTYKHKGNVIEIWYEDEYLFALDINLMPSLIATLRASLGER